MININHFIQEIIYPHYKIKNGTSKVNIRDIFKQNASLCSDLIRVVPFICIVLREKRERISNTTHFQF